MTKEEKYAIEKLKNMYWYVDEYEEEELVNIVLNLVEKQDKIINNIKNYINDL